MFFLKRVGRSAHKNKYYWKYFGVGRSKIKMFVYYADFIDLYYFSKYLYCQKLYNYMWSIRWLRTTITFKKNIYIYFLNYLRKKTILICIKKYFFYVKKLFLIRVKNLFTRINIVIYIKKNILIYAN